MATRFGALAALVTEFLDFARPRPPQLRPTPARALCERAIHLLSPKATEAQTGLDLDFPNREPVLNVDSAKIEQVLLNLLGNAVEALAPAGGGRVTLRVRRQPRSVFFEVEDTGPGLPSPDAPDLRPLLLNEARWHGVGPRHLTPNRVRSRRRPGGRERPGRTVFRVTLPLEVE